MLRLLLVVLVSALLAACSSEKTGTGDAAQAQADGGGIPIERKKIERLDPKAFIEITIDLMSEKGKWEAEWINFMKKKREEYFKAWGLTEKQFNEFAGNNMAALQRYLRDNPQANQAYMDASRTRSRQGP